MTRLTVGMGRGKSKMVGKQQNSVGEDVICVLGLCAVCLLLLLPQNAEVPADASGDEAVAVMAVLSSETDGGDEPASVPSEESVFDRIGRFFAGVLFGE